MDIGEFRSQYLVNIVKHTYRYGWFASAIAAILRFQNDVISIDYLFLYLTFSALSIAATFIPLRFYLKQPLQHYALLIPQAMIFVAITAQYVFENPGMHLYNTATTLFVLLSGVWFLGRYAYNLTIVTLVVIHIIGLLFLEEPLVFHEIFLLLACTIPILLFLFFIRTLLSHYQRLLKNEARLNKDKDTFLSSVSHEIRNPLNGIIGSLNLIEDLDDANQKKLDVARFSAVQLHKIVDDILVANKLIDGRFEPDYEWVTLRDWQQNIQHIASEIEFKAGLHFDFGIQLWSDEAFEKVELRFDKRRVNQILTNLLVNANKYSIEGQIDLFITIDKESIEIHVQDTGIGIEDTMRQRIFEQYQRAPNSNRLNAQGLGLGLYICKQYCKMMNGHIFVESEKGKGSIFMVQLPIETRKLESVSVSPVETDSQANTKEFSVLIVEDNETNQFILNLMISKIVTKIHVAGNGKEALELIESEEIDLILSDINMPVMNGYEFIQALRSTGQTIPCYAVTGNITDSDIAEQKAAGFNGSVEKPYNAKEITQLLQQAQKKPMSV